jgi:Na+-translocating ferredoxin:NAD+ oxidoreductase RnfD subunit
MAGLVFSSLMEGARETSFILPGGPFSNLALSKTSVVTASALGHQSFANSGLDAGITDFLNKNVFSWVGAALPSGYVDLFIGNRPGAIGAVSVALILLGSVFLLSRRIIRWDLPFFSILSFSALTWAFGGLSVSGDYFTGDVLKALCSGSVAFVAFFVVPEPVSSPVYGAAKCVYALLVGALMFALGQLMPNQPLLEAWAVILANCLVPLIDGIAFNRRESFFSGKVLNGEDRDGGNK